MDKRPSKIMWDVPYEELMTLELAKANHAKPSHLLLHLKNFKRSEAFVRVIKCSSQEESEGRESQAVRICSLVRQMWKARQSHMKCLRLKVPSSQRNACFAWSEADEKDPRSHSKVVIKTRGLSSSGSVTEKRFSKHVFNFTKIWSSEQVIKVRCTFCRRQASEDDGICSIWRPICPDGYVSAGDIVRLGNHPPNVATVYDSSERHFAFPLGYDLVWRNCLDDYSTPISIWHPRAPEGYVSLGCVAVPSFTEPEPNNFTHYCVAESLAEETVYEEQKIWMAPDSYPWACHVYQVRTDTLHFMALRQPKEESDYKPMRVRIDYHLSVQPSDAR